MSPMNSPESFPLPPEVAATMSAFSRLADEKLPGRIRGLYLTGSLALNDYRSGRGGMDAVAGSDTTMGASEIEALRQGHTELRRTRPSPKLDGVHLTWPALASAPVGLSATYCLHNQFEPTGDFAV